MPSFASAAIDAVGFAEEPTKQPRGRQEVGRAEQVLRHKMCSGGGINLTIGSRPRLFDRIDDGEERVFMVGHNNQLRGRVGTRIKQS